MGEESSGQARLLKATYASTFRASFPAFPHMQTSRFLSTLYIFTLQSKQYQLGVHSGHCIFPTQKTLYIARLLMESYSIAQRHPSLQFPSTSLESIKNNNLPFPTRLDQPLNLSRNRCMHTSSRACTYVRSLVCASTARSTSIAMSTATTTTTTSLQASNIRPLDGRVFFSVLTCSIVVVSAFPSSIPAFLAPA
jgi:hypothetical protein